MKSKHTKPMSSLVYISLLSILVLLLIKETTGNARESSSEKYKLSQTDRKDNRREGYCLKLCGLGTDAASDGYESMSRHYNKRKDAENYYALRMAIIGSYDENPIGELFFEVDDILDDGTRSISTWYKLLQVYCEASQIEYFEECFDIEMSYVATQQATKCYSYCTEQAYRSNLFPKFEEMAPERQLFETCLDSFRGPHEIFDYHQNFNKTKMLESFQRNGFLIVQNFFESDFMKNVSQIMNDWDETKLYKNYSYDNFFSTYDGQLRDYEDRLEIVLPYDYPFDTILHRIHASPLIEILSHYGDDKPVNVDFISSILSRPGAVPQDAHVDHGNSASFMKVDVIIHDIPEKSGPTSFCPCTQLGSDYYYPYFKHCYTHFHPAFVPAGSIVFYDHGVKHRGSGNFGKTRRFILDLSYRYGEAFNHYERTFPAEAQEHIKRYRHDFRNLYNKH